MSVTKALYVQIDGTRFVNAWTTVNGERRDWVGPQDFDSSGQLTSNVVVQFASSPSKLPDSLSSSGLQEGQTGCALEGGRVTAVPN